MTCSELDYLLERARRHIQLVATQQDVVDGIAHVLRAAQECIQRQQRRGSESLLGLPVNAAHLIGLGIYRAWQESKTEDENAAW